MFRGLDELAEGTVRLVVETLRGAPGPRVTLGLAGGSTPQAAYRMLAFEPVGWERVDLWLSDERWVPWDDDRSNGRMAEEALARHVPATLHRPPWWEDLAPPDSAAHYEAVLRHLLSDGSGDLVMLGMGEDGHTASLFPDTAALSEQWRWYVANWVPALEAWRLTATPRLLRTARSVAVMVAGQSKAATLAAALEGPDGLLPIQVLRRAAGTVTWLVDEAAAAGLSTTPVQRQ